MVRVDLHRHPLDVPPHAVGRVEDEHRGPAVRVNGQGLYRRTADEVDVGQLHAGRRAPRILQRQVLVEPRQGGPLGEVPLGRGRVGPERIVPIADRTGAEVVAVDVEGSLRHDRQRRLHPNGYAQQSPADAAVGAGGARDAIGFVAEVAEEHDHGRPAVGRNRQRLHRVVAPVGEVVELDGRRRRVRVLQGQEFAEGRVRRPLGKVPLGGRAGDADHAGRSHPVGVEVNITLGHAGPGQRDAGRHFLVRADGGVDVDGGHLAGGQRGTLRQRPVRQVVVDRGHPALVGHQQAERLGEAAAGEPLRKVELRRPTGEARRQDPPEVLRRAVVAQCPDPGAAQVAGVDQVVLQTQRGRVVVVQLSPAAVVAAAGIVRLGAPPGHPGHLADRVPRVAQLLRAGQLRQDAVVRVRLAPRSHEVIGRGALRRPFAAVVGHAQDDFRGRRLCQVLLHGTGVVVGPAVQGRVRACLLAVVSGGHVVGHDEEGVHHRGQVADLEDAAVPAGRAAVGVDADLVVGELGVDLRGQLGHEVGEAGLERIGQMSVNSAGGEQTRGGNLLHRFTGQKATQSLPRGVAEARPARDRSRCIEGIIRK